MQQLDHHRMRLGLAAATLAALAAISACTSADQGGMGEAMAGESQMSIASTDMGSKSSVMVGGQPMLPSKTIVGNAVNSAEHTTLVAAVETAWLTR